MTLLTLLILILATWRISSLLTNEEGPFEILSRLRKLTGAFDCLWCMSIWTGVFITGLYWYSSGLATLLCLPFALSAGAVAWEKWNG
jgi:hypothetical protein